VKDMKLVKEKWLKKDIEEYNKYLKSIRNEDKIEWTKNIVNTKMDVLAIKTNVLRDIAKEIMKGNYLSFLEQNNHLYYESLVISGIIISNIKDFNLLKKYLYKYSLLIDSWASCDILSFKTKNKEEDYYNLALEYINYPLEFQKRLGISMLFPLVNDAYIDRILSIIDSFTEASYYYVDMILAWLLCDSFIKERDKTLQFFKKNNANSFVINKAISKCHDSYRVTKEDKEMLKKYKK
jgi:hypothetical protein